MGEVVGQPMILMGLQIKDDCFLSIEMSGTYFETNYANYHFTPRLDKLGAQYP